MPAAAVFDMAYPWKALALVAREACSAKTLLAYRTSTSVTLARSHACRHMKREMELMRLWKRRAASRAGPRSPMMSEWGLVETPSSTLEAVRRVALSIVRGYRSCRWEVGGWGKRSTTKLSARKNKTGWIVWLPSNGSKELAPTTRGAVEVYNPHLYYLVSHRAQVHQSPNPHTPLLPLPLASSITTLSAASANANKSA